MAAQMGHSEVVKVLLLRGADRDADRHVRCLLVWFKHSKGYTNYVLVGVIYALCSKQSHNHIEKILIFYDFMIRRRAI